MPCITHFLLSCPSAAELSPSNPERQTVLQRTPQKLSWRFCGRNHTLTNRHGLAAARVGADKIAIVEAPFDARQNQAYLINGCGQRLHDWKTKLADFVVYDVAAENNEVALFAYCLQDGWDYWIAADMSDNGETASMQVVRIK